MTNYPTDTDRAGRPLMLGRSPTRSLALAAPPALDTALIRRSVETSKAGRSEMLKSRHRQVLALCAALDAARAEQERLLTVLTKRTARAGAARGTRVR